MVGALRAPTINSGEPKCLGTLPVDRVMQIGEKELEAFREIGFQDQLPGAILIIALEHGVAAVRGLTGGDRVTDVLFVTP